ncbi:MAG: YraN family protein [Gammaproteobacteria bacterium]|nr:YraN family protein [Gammaproteobacteria bacterium]
MLGGRLTSVFRGRQHEASAERYLLTQGLRTLSKNFLAHGGELDLVMEDGPNVVFVEVRFRAKTRYASAIETITTTKQRRIVRAAASYLQKYPALADRPCRFDVVGLDGNELAPSIQWIKDAFTA